MAAGQPADDRQQRGGRELAPAPGAVRERGERDRCDVHVGRCYVDGRPRPPGGIGGTPPCEHGRIIAAREAAGVEGAMLDKLEAIGRTAGHAAELIFDRTATVDPWLLAAGDAAVPRRADRAPARVAHDPARRLPRGDRPAPARRDPRLPGGRRRQRGRPCPRRRRGQARARAPAHRGRALLDARGHLHPRDAVRDRLRHRARRVGAGGGLHPGPHHQRRAARARRLARPAPPSRSAAVVAVAVVVLATVGRGSCARCAAPCARGRRSSPRRGASLVGVASWQALARLIRLGLDGGLHGRLRPAGDAGDRRARHGGPGRRADPAARPGQRRACAWRCSPTASSR